MNLQEKKYIKIANTNLEVALHHLEVAKNNLEKATLNNAEAIDLNKIEWVLLDLIHIKKKYTGYKC